MNNPKLGNRIILLILAAALAVGSLFTQWGVLTVTDQDLRDAYLDINGQRVTGAPAESFFRAFVFGGEKERKVPVDGLHGSVVLRPIHFPYWGLVAGVVLGLFLTLANSCRFADVPRWLVASLLAAAILLTVWDLVYTALHGAVGVGGFLVIAAAYAGLWAQRAVVPPPRVVNA